MSSRAIEELYKVYMKEVKNINKLSFCEHYDVSKRKFFASYEGKCITPKWGKTYYWYDAKNDKLYYENFSCIKQFFHTFFGYKKQFNRRNLWTFFIAKNMTTGECPKRKAFTGKVALITILWEKVRKGNIATIRKNEYNYKHRYDTPLADKLISDDQIITQLEGERLSPNDLVNTISLSSAISCNRVQLFHYLIEKETAAHVVTPSELLKALRSSITQGRYDLALDLIERGADPAFNGDSEEDKVSPLQAVVWNLPKEGEIPLPMGRLIDAILQANPQVNILSHSESPLMAFCQRGYFDLVKRLVEKHQADVNFSDPDSFQKSPLFASIKAGFPLICQYLIEKGAKVGAWEFGCAFSLWVDSKKETNKKILDLLVEKIDLRDIKVAKDCLEKAMQKRDKEAIQYLLDHGADINGGERWDTPFRIAINNKDFDMMQFILQKNGDLSKGHPLFLAQGNIAILTFLLDHGADINDQDIRGNTLLHEAAQEGNEELINFLLARHARLDIQDKSQFADTPARLARRSGFTVLADKLEAQK